MTANVKKISDGYSQKLMAWRCTQAHFFVIDSNLNVPSNGCRHALHELA
jgi:hypothetical protein